MPSLEALFGTATGHVPCVNGVLLHRGAARGAKNRVVASEQASNGSNASKNTMKAMPSPAVALPHQQILKLPWRARTTPPKVEALEEPLVRFKTLWSPNWLTAPECCAIPQSR